MGFKVFRRVFVLSLFAWREKNDTKQNNPEQNDPMSTKERGGQSNGPRNLWDVPDMAQGNTVVNQL